MSTLKVPGAQLYYEASGDGPLLILIPGAKGEGEVFRPLAHLLFRSTGLRTMITGWIPMLMTSGA